MKPVLLYPITPLLHRSIRGGLTNQAPVAIEGPINQQPVSHQVLLGNGPPPAAVVAVVTVVTQSKVATLRHGERTVWLRQIFVA